MCDTMARIEKDVRVFAKNSDRDPGEPQLLLYCTGTEGLTNATHPEHKASYENKQYQLLIQAAGSYPSPFKALISRPSWMWGAEMGINECGVAIGNEAVFSRSPVDRNGLLGMDILRLALHNSANSMEAVSILIDLITKYGQGGNASYSGHLRYHNSFLIQDPRQTFILETADKRWALEKVDSYASISNGYTIGNEYQDADTRTLARHTNFKHSHASPLHLLFTKGTERQRFTTSRLSQTEASWTGLRDILISNKGSAGTLEHSMQSICLDAKGLVASQTTSSMIVEYRDTSFLVWLTGSPLPIYHPFIPFTLAETQFASNPFARITRSYAFSKQRIDLTKSILNGSPQAREAIAKLARNQESNFEAKVRKPFLENNQASLDSACNACFAMLSEHDKAVRNILKTK